MKVTSTRQVTISIHLEEDEAIWLRNYIQNWPAVFGVEPQETAAMRKALFEELQHAIKRS